MEVRKENMSEKGERFIQAPDPTKHKSIDLVVTGHHQLRFLTRNIFTNISHSETQTTNEGVPNKSTTVVLLENLPNKKTTSGDSSGDISFMYPSRTARANTPTSIFIYGTNTNWRNHTKLISLQSSSLNATLFRTRVLFPTPSKHLLWHLIQPIAVVTATPVRVQTQQTNVNFPKGTVDRKPVKGIFGRSSNFRLANGFKRSMPARLLKKRMVKSDAEEPLIAPRKKRYQYEDEYDWKNDAELLDYEEEEKLTFVDRFNDRVIAFIKDRGWLVFLTLAVLGILFSAFKQVALGLITYIKCTIMSIVYRIQNKDSTYWWLVFNFVMKVELDPPPYWWYIENKAMIQQAVGYMFPMTRDRSRPLTAYLFAV